MLIPLKHKQHGHFTMEIDDEDWDKIKDYNLCINKTSNPNTAYCKATIYENCQYVKALNIHRVIMGIGDFKDDKRQIHHKDGNGLNNKKSNLEICTAMYNSQSFRQAHRNNYNIYFERDTEKIKRKKKWRFTIKVNGVMHRKRFLTEQEAIDYKKEFMEKLITEE